MDSSSYVRNRALFINEKWDRSLLEGENRDARPVWFVRKETAVLGLDSVGPKDMRLERLETPRRT